MAVHPPGRVRRAPRWLLFPALLTVLAIALGGCSGDEPAPGVDMIRGLPDAAAVEENAADVEGGEVPEDLTPRQDLIGAVGSLNSAEQRCARDYAYTVIDDVCLMGSTSSDRTILLWGDSRAAMWMPALARIAEQTDHRLAVFTKLGCAPLLDVTPWLDSESRPYDECKAWNDQMRAVVDDYVKPDIVVLAGAVRNVAVTEDGQPRPLGEGDLDNTWTPDPDAGQVWQDGLDSTLESLTDNTSTDVYVLGDAPYPTQDAGVCLAEHDDAVEECEVTRATGVYDEHEKAVQETTEERGATYVPTVPWMCDDEVCPAVIDGHVVFRDSFHLNREYVLWISRALGSALGLDDWYALNLED